MSNSRKARDKAVNRVIHRLFWRANFVDRWGVPICLLTKIPALTLFNVFIPLEIAFGIEAIIAKDLDEVSVHATRIFLMAIGYAVLWTIGTIFISRNGVVGGVYLQRKVFANYLNKDHDFYSNTFFGSLGAQAARLRDSYIEYNILMLGPVPKQIVIVVAGILVIGYQSVPLALTTLGLMTVTLSFTMLSSTWRLKYRRLVAERSSDVAGSIGDALTHAPTVKSFAAEKHEEHRLASLLEQWRKAQFMSWVLSAPADAGRAILAALASVVLLLMTANMYIDGSISIAIVALIQLYVIRLIASTLEIAEIIKGYEHAMGGAYQPVATMLVEPDITDKKPLRNLPTAKKMGITFDGVTFRYPEANETAFAIADLRLEITPGQKVGLVGYSGSGKTTLTKLLLRFMDVTDGAILINGIDIRELPQQELRRHVAYVPQEPILFHRSIYENIAYGNPDASKKDVMKAAEMAYVDEFVQSLPDGYDTLVGERGVKLSGGQRQRVAIARAMLKNAPILVLDEATSALDSHSEQRIQEALWNLMRDRTALVIAHRLSTIQRMDTIVVVDKGHIIQQGTHEQLVTQRKQLYASLWSHQSGGYLGQPADDKHAA
jgi:ATP-binding cassette subfamily B protein